MIANEVTTRVVANHLLPGDVILDGMGNERSVTVVRIVSPRLVTVSSISQNGMPCGDSYPPDQMLNVARVPGFAPVVHS